MKPLDARVNYFESIPAVPKREMILARLGYRKSTTVLDEKEAAMLEENIKLGRLLCETKGAFVRLGIKEHAEDKVRLEYDIELESRSLSGLLAQSDEVVFMASTVGKPIVERIESEIESGSAGKGVVIDSVASQTADAGLDWMMGFINRLLAREGKKLTKYRYSPGYGDLPLKNQKILFDALNLQRLGLDITETYMLVPEKSVIAVAGIERI